MIISPVVLLILDGWGFSRNTRGNAIFDAYTPAMDRIALFHPSLTLQAAGFSVGMLWGEPGNSGTGHTTLGAGRIVYNHLPRILREIRNGNFFENPVLEGAVAHAKKNGSRLHLVGLVSGATVHSYLEHLYALFAFAKRADVPTLLHAFTDGRDAPPRQGLRILESIVARVETEVYPVTLASVAGRFYAMDRTGSWDRVERLWKALVAEEGLAAGDVLSHMRQEYARGVTDEFISPAKAQGRYRIRDNDAIVFFNFREDGLRELVEACALPEFNAFPVLRPHNLYIATLTTYDTHLPVGVVFPEPPITNVLSEALSHAGVKQLKAAESQKFSQLAHFFNGGREEPFPFESRSIFPSDTAAQLEENPDMRADDIGQEVVHAVERTAYEFIVANFANADALAHTGNYGATMRGVEAIDRNVDRIYQAVAHRRGALMITSDHGSAEELFNTRTGDIKTGHSENPVPFYFVTARNRFRAMRSEQELARRFVQPLGVLADVAPTVLELLGVKKPPEMTGQSLLGLL